MRNVLLSAVVSLLPAACVSAPSAASPHHEEPAAPASARVFGAPIDPATPEVELSALVRSPEAYEGRSVRVRGTVHRVCQRAGCWIELTTEGVTPVFVPMAGHAFFLPRDAEGQLAEVEGTIELRVMGGNERAHLESEGATATASAAQLVAAGVRVSPAGHRQGS
ncbi:MAG: DUF4920 domain-containing protein [Polyangiaceae bacterium]|nr:DUF4920 domain-containing protein [Polyangiaceae bacterium]